MKSFHNVIVLWMTYRLAETYPDTDRPVDVGGHAVAQRPTGIGRVERAEAADQPLRDRARRLVGG